MGTGYTRNDTANNIADGNVINASDLDGEFNAIEAAFDEATGHTHDGTADEGGPITKLGPAQDLEVTTSAVLPKTDNTLDLGSSSFEFKNLYVDGTAYVDAIDFNGTAITATGTELNYSSGVTSAIQTQLNDKQPLDSELTALAGVTSAADKVPYFTGAGTAAVADFTSFGRSLVDDADASTARSTLGLVIGTNVQAYDGELQALAGLTSAADKVPYFTGSGTAAVADFTSFGRSLVDDADASAARTTLGLVIGTNVQAFDQQLADVAGLTPTDNNFIVGNGTNFVTESGSTARTSLGLGTIATQDANNVSITGGSITGITDLAVADGGTGASTAANARVNLLPSYTGNGNKVLALNSGATDVQWTTASSGDVVGPASATDNGIVRFDGTTGKLVQNSAVTIDDTTGSLNFTATGARITGDFSNATAANRVWVQTSTTNGNTNFGVIPNGTSTSATIRASNNSDPTNSAIGQISAGSSTVTIASTILGTGTLLPMVFDVGGEKMRIDTSGNVGIGTSSPAQKLDISSNNTAGTALNVLRFTDTDTSIGSPDQPLGRVEFYTSDADNPGVSAYIQGQSGTQGGTNIGFATGTSATIAERMRIDSSGNVGIGTNAPGAKLDVSSSSNNIVRSVSTGGYAAFQRIAPTGQQVYDFYTVNNSEVARITADGSNFLTFSTGSSATERMRIDSGGNILIAKAARATITTDNDGSFDMNAASNFKCTPTGNITLTFTNITSGQVGNIILVNGSNYTISAAATTKVATGALTTMSATGTYWLSYYSDGTNVYVANTGALA